jgi:hypothetical protein
MPTPMRSVPLDYDELSAAIKAGAFPHERNWIDFKRRLYPVAISDTDAAAVQADAEARERSARNWPVIWPAWPR